MTIQQGSKVERVPCPRCDAEGTIEPTEMKIGPDLTAMVDYCPRCLGSQYLRPCNECGDLVPEGRHSMQKHGVCLDHAPDCTGVCTP